MPEELKIYNLPQDVEGGIPINGAKDGVILFHNLTDMKANCTFQDGGKPITLAADTKLIHENGQYRFDEEISG